MADEKAFRAMPEWKVTNTVNMRSEKYLAALEARMGASEMLLPFDADA